VRRALLGAAIATGALAGVPAGAHAAFAPAVSATMVDEGVADGWRTVRVDVASTCGTEAPADTVSSVQADLVGRWHGSATRTFTLDDDHIRYPTAADAEATAGSAATYRFRVTGAVRVAAVGYVTCSSDEAYESREAKSPPTGTLAAPPRLTGFEFEGISYNGGNRCRPRSGRRFQLGAQFALRWFVEADPRALFGKQRLTGANVAQIKLHISGGGRPAFHHPASRRGFRAVGGIVSGYYFRPRTRQPVKLWVTAGGLDSNVLTVPVGARPRGCR
jgi:hypothetical protein